MSRFSLFLTVSCVFLFGAFGTTRVAGQQKKVEAIDEPILGKTVGEWIKILRTHENPKFRRAALIALEASNSAGRSGLPALLNAIEKDKEPQVRQEGVMLLGRLGPETPGAIKALVAALQTDKADKVREAAANAIGDDKFLPQARDYLTAFADGLKDTHSGTRIAVAVVLRNLGENARPVFPALFEAAKNPKEHPLVRTAAVHVLSRHAKDNSQTVPLLLELVNNIENPVALREVAIDGLGRAGKDTPEIIAALVKALDADKSVEVRKASAVALVSLGAKANAAWPTIKAHVSDVKEESSIRNHLIRLTGVLAKTNADAISPLTEAAINDKSTENRIAAIQELGELGPLAKGAIEPLAKIEAQDARATVREAAGKAVKQISGK